jgi:diguanylate cyclase (GGDEF)-like protein/PAS domain S-box-containing protein
MGNKQHVLNHRGGNISLSRSLRVRFLFWISVILLLTLGGAAYYVYSSQQAILTDSLQSKVVAIGQFIALISPGAIYTFDINHLDRYVRQISEDDDICFAQIRSNDDLPMTTYLPADISQAAISDWIKKIDQSPQAQPVVVDYMAFYRFPIMDNEERLGQVLVGMDTRHMQTEIQKILLDLFKIFSAIVLSLGGLIFIIFKWHVLDPVVRLKEVAMCISHGDFTQKVSIYTDDELGQLADCFNNMMDEINIDREALIATNKQLAQEIHQRQLTNQELRKLSLAVEQSPASVIITDLRGDIEYVNPKFSAVSGFEKDEVIGKQANILGQQTKDRARIWKQLISGEVWKGEFRNLRKNGEEYWESAVIAPIRNEEGVITHFIAVKEDITKRKAIEQTLIDQATHDQLTGLPNRFLAMDRLEQLLQYTQRDRCCVGIIYIDLDHFKIVNDSLGHATGDQLLVMVASRISQQLRDEDTLCRLGGDEFMALTPSLKHPAEDLKVILDRLIFSMKTPFVVSGSEINVTLSLGISLYPDDGDSVGVLMSNADMAMYEAKRSGRNAFRFFTPKLNEQIQYRMVLESRLRHALDENQFYLVYQPVIRLSDGAMVGVETLLRWYNPELGEVAPSDFIHIAEQFGFIRPITDWIFETIVKHIQGWAYFPNKFWVAVNVSPAYVREEAFLKALSKAIQQATLFGFGLCMEITENLFLHNDKEAMGLFHGLEKLGVASALDDFGTGYSSLAYLKRFPVNYLKIDRTFVDGLPNDAEDKTLTEAIVLMGHRLGIEIIAEGVEDQLQLDYLHALNVEYAQGFHIARPMNEAQFVQYLASLSEGRSAS